TLAACKRRISELEEEIGNLRGVQQEKFRESPFSLAGRGIRRLVSLADRVKDLVNEADRRACLESD
ncbi:hypothetical protein PAXRUDRAFT_72956, partial [Paxillus rubicundulus Ve08.2h10]